MHHVAEPNLLFVRHIAPLSRPFSDFVASGQAGVLTCHRLLNLFMRRMLPARIAKLSRLHAFRVLLLILRRRVVAVFAIPALQRNDFPHDPNSLLTNAAPKRRLKFNYSIISVTAPAPTVWPPSRIANRKPFSSATGVIRLTSQLTLSPGITISTPCGSFTSPVTSVVRK